MRSLNTVEVLRAYIRFRILVNNNVSINVNENLEMWQTHQARSPRRAKYCRRTTRADSFARAFVCAYIRFRILVNNNVRINVNGNIEMLQTHKERLP